MLSKNDNSWLKVVHFFELFLISALLGDCLQARPLFKDRRKFPQMADPVLQGQYPTRGLYQALAVAAMCVQEQPTMRPLIADVVTALTYLASQKYEPDSQPVQRSDLAPGTPPRTRRDNNKKQNSGSKRDQGRRLNWKKSKFQPSRNWVNFSWWLQSPPFPACWGPGYCWRDFATIRHVWGWFCCLSHDGSERIGPLLAVHIGYQILHHSR